MAKKTYEGINNALRRANDPHSILYSLILVQLFTTYQKGPLSVIIMRALSNHGCYF